jgi:hypothetical protein
MPALVSPGVSVTVIDESAYLPTAVGTIPFVLFASSENKVVNNVIAPGTKKTNAGKIYGISSQRELVATFGTPTFRLNASGTPIHADELNEYGLLAAYSALGAGNRVWAMRADIDLDQLVGTTVRPTGSPANGTNWFDYSKTNFGIYEYDAVNNTYSNKKPMVIVDREDAPYSNQVPVPNETLGAIGSYAVVAYDSNNYVFYKNSSNTWVAVGTEDWQESLPTHKGTLSTINFTADAQLLVNTVGINIGTGTNDLADVVGDINSANITGVTAGLENGYLTFYVTKSATSNGNDADGILSLADGSGDALSGLGLVGGMHYPPTLYYGSFNQNPAWSHYDAIPRPSGSIWLKTSSQGQGASFALKRYNSTTQAWVTVAAPLYADAYDALYSLDKAGGGENIAASSVFVKYNTNNDGKLSFKFYQLKAGGPTTVTGAPAGTFTSGDSFSMLVTEPGTDMPTTYNLYVDGINGASFVSAVLAANIPNVTAKLNPAGSITLTHKTGGVISLVNTSIGTNPVTTAGFTTSTDGVVPNIVEGSINLTNWKLSRYTFSDSTPSTNPEDGTLWYYSDPTAIDIMIADTDGWKGYKNVGVDARGYNLQLTDPRGVIVSAGEPMTQSDNTDLVAGDLWLDSSDLENYPKLYRFTATGKWQLIDNTDSVSQNGIIFADARWADSDTVDPISDAYPSVVAMQTSDYLDLDAPDYRLFPRGTLMFNTRRGGYNVKKFVSNYFNAQAYPNQVLPNARDAWVTDSGNKEDGTPYAGHHAQRALVVKAMKAGLDGSLDIREEGYNFTLLACPGYPELIVNLIGLNNDRSQTGFIIGDMPMTLPATINSITEYSNQVAINRDPYVALYYPTALTNDLSGNEVAVPASHIMLRTFLRNDNVAYPWFAPAGTRRGLVDNASAIGYVDANSGLFVKTGINHALRDAMYEQNVNPITLLYGTGLVVYGQKTRSAVSSSLDRVNVARLVNYIRAVLQPIANQFLFEPNDKITRDQVKQTIESVFNDLIVKRGIYDYLVVCDTSNNTGDRIARNELYVDIAIEPMKAVEFIYIPIRLKNPGTIKGGTA